MMLFVSWNASLFNVHPALRESAFGEREVLAPDGIVLKFFLS